jgi:CP family cyanate transporter-like MFS transporter
MRQFWTAASLLWLAGAGLRMPVLAVPPVIMMMQADLGLTGTQIGILSGLPVILFALAALPGSLLIARFGALAVLVAGLVVAGVASGLRGVLLSVPVLYAATIAMSAGIAIMQPALPPLVRAWMPERVSFGSALYTNGLLIGETLPVMLMLPLVFPFIDSSWRIGLAVWGMPLVVIALLCAAFAPSRGPAEPAPVNGADWWPDWSNKLIWQSAFLIGAPNSIYFCANAFLPGYLSHVGRPDLISATLTAVNFGQLPASFILLGLARRLERRAWPFVACGVTQLACLVGIVATASWWTVLYAGVLGFVGAVVLTLGFALPALLAPRMEVARMAAAMFTVSYTESLVMSVASGAAWDIAGSPRYSFAVMAIAALPLVAVPLLAGFFRRADAAEV